MDLFMKLPPDIINHIVSFDKHFILRKGELVSVIPKDDERYKILHFVTLHLNNPPKIRQYPPPKESIYAEYVFDFPNLYDINERETQHVNNDMFEARIRITQDFVLYNFFIGRLKPLNGNLNKQLRYYKGDLKDHDWHYIDYNYIRR